MEAITSQACHAHLLQHHIRSRHGTFFLPAIAFEIYPWGRCKERSRPATGHRPHDLRKGFTSLHENGICRVTCLVLKASSSAARRLQMTMFISSIDSKEVAKQYHASSNKLLIVVGYRSGLEILWRWIIRKLQRGLSRVTPSSSATRFFISL